MAKQAKPKVLTIDERVSNLELIIVKLIKEVKQLKSKKSNPIGFNVGSSYVASRDINPDDD